MENLAHIQNDDDPLAFNIAKVVKGTKMMKYGRKGFGHHRGIRVALDQDAIIYHFTKKILFKDIVDIKKGQKTLIFELNKHPAKEHLSFSIMYRGDDEKSSLDLICDTQEDYDLWMSTLPILINRAKANNAARGTKLGLGSN